MIILSIETSCDETAVSVVKAEGGLDSPSFSVLGNALYSQVAIHMQYGGVYPNLAKREHAKNLIPLLKKTLKEAGFLKNKEVRIKNEELDKLNSLFLILNSILEREKGLYEQFVSFLQKYSKPPIDMITVTSGPGLEPALWVGISFAKALGLAWNIPVVPVNHMEGHIASVLLNRSDEFQILNYKFQNKKIQFPAIALLISGGHTEIVHIKKWGEYEILGQTRDDAVGEAFDKVARMLSLPYPGGPYISALAEISRTNADLTRNNAEEDEKIESNSVPNLRPSASSQPKSAGQFDQIKLPRPMIHSNDLDFSFSGLKTAVLYKIRELKELTPEIKMEIAREFEDAVVDVLISKTEKALLESDAKSLIVAGGVIANKKIREAFSDLISQKYPEIPLFIPGKDLSTDNAIMIAMAGYIETLVHPELLNKSGEIIAKGNLKYK